MRLLLDTHALLWALGDVPKLSRQARELIEVAESDVFVSAASGWEIAIKSGLGGLPLPGDFEAQLAERTFRPLSITIAHGLRAGSLPPHHRDPFDRMLVAQAQLEGLTIVTRDPNIPRYGVATLPA